MKPFDVIQSSRTFIRKFRTGDKKDLISLLCNKEVTKNTGFPDEMITPEGVSELLDIRINPYGGPELPRTGLYLQEKELDLKE
ncbi:MAG: hypothetical protein AAF361_10225 [Bacteroidota bacterium]